MLSVVLTGRLVLHAALVFPSNLTDPKRAPDGSVNTALVIWEFPFPLENLKKHATSHVQKISCLIEKKNNAKCQHNKNNVIFLGYAGIAEVKKNIFGQNANLQLSRILGGLCCEEQISRNRLIT